MNRWTTSALVAGVTGLWLAYSPIAATDDAPRRKSGLWEIKMQSSMGPGHTMQMCVDNSSDNMLEQRRARKKPDCSTMDVKRQGDKTLVHMVCNMDGKTMISDSVITGDMSSHYRMENTMSFDPPMQGMGSMKTVMEGKWLGACKPGQKPGDVIMSGGMMGGAADMGKMSQEDREKMIKSMQDMLKR